MVRTRLQVILKPCIMSLSDLPADVLSSVLCNLPAHDVLAVACTCKALHDTARDPTLWQRLAVTKWGRHVPEQPGEGVTWRSWALHRMSFKGIRASPYQFLQESYQDPWQHIVACVLMSRTSGSTIITNTVAAFFAAYPTPSAVLDASVEDMATLIRPLGLQPVRTRSVRELSSGFLRTAWVTPDEFFGCGKFVRDSWRIFCRGDVSGKGVDDVNLKRYVSWARSGKVEARDGGRAAATAAKRRRAEQEEEEKARAEALGLIAPGMRATRACLAKLVASAGAEAAATAGAVASNAPTCRASKKRATSGDESQRGAKDVRMATSSVCDASGADGTSGAAQRQRTSRAPAALPADTIKPEGNAGAQSPQGKQASRRRGG